MTLPQNYLKTVSMLNLFLGLHTRVDTPHTVMALGITKVREYFSSLLSDYWFPEEGVARQGSQGGALFGGGLVWRHHRDPNTAQPPSNTPPPTLGGKVTRREFK